MAPDNPQTHHLIRERVRYVISMLDPVLEILHDQHGYHISPIMDSTDGVVSLAVVIYTERTMTDADLQAALTRARQNAVRYDTKTVES